MWLGSRFPRAGPCRHSSSLWIARQSSTHYLATGEETGKPTPAGLRKRWNQVKETECVDTETGEVWWPQISKEAFADGIRAAVDGYWNWQTSRAGTRPGRRMGLPLSPPLAVW